MFASDLIGRDIAGHTDLNVGRISRRFKSNEKERLVLMNFCEDYFLTDDSQDFVNRFRKQGRIAFVAESRGFLGNFQLLAGVQVTSIDDHFAVSLQELV
ncbi:MAG: hypothetical protein ACD_15C00047G0009 [uncultured bacterium]|nr:MAG: hypothetical protein ACD_15C00047G0009 [uncultured bacterium]